MHEYGCLIWWRGKHGHNISVFKHLVHNVVWAAGMTKQKCVAEFLKLKSKAKWSYIFARWFKNWVPIALISYIDTSGIVHHQQSSGIADIMYARQHGLNDSDSRWLRLRFWIGRYFRNALTDIIYFFLFMQTGDKYDQN